MSAKKKVDSTVTNLADCWEDIQEEELNTKMKLLQRNNAAAHQQQNNGVIMGANVMRGSTSEPIGGVTVTPKFTILKRPTIVSNTAASATTSSPFDDDVTPRSQVPTTGSNSGKKEVKKPVMKTLQQREQEYKEARLRILGDVKYSDDEDDDTDDEAKQKTYQASKVKQKLAQQLPQQQPLTEIIREPKGPDGTPGFTLKR